MDGCQILLWMWWVLQNLMKQAKFVAYEQNVIVYIFLTLKLCFDTMLLLAWWSAPEAKLITKFNKNYTQSHFVHMLQTLPVSSNSEVLIMFPEQFDINSWIIEVSTIYRRKKLRSLTLVLWSISWFWIWCYKVV